MSSTLRLSALGVLLTGCMGEPALPAATRATAEAADDANASAAAANPPAAHAPPSPRASAPATRPAVAGSNPQPPTPAAASPLTAEELALIEADPATLTPEQRRARGYAFRKRTMQNPDSPAAKNLQRIAEQIRSGEMAVPEHILGSDATPPNRGTTTAADGAH